MRLQSALALLSLVSAATVCDSASAQCWSTAFASNAPGVDGLGADADVFTFFEWDDGGGPDMYVGGLFTSIGDQPAANFVARWDGAGWSTLGSGMDGSVGTFVVFDDGTGPALFVGGSFTTAGGVFTPGIAKWDGTTWSAVGGGISGGGFSDTVSDMIVWNDGSGDKLYVTGDFTDAGGVPVSHFARWDGATWESVGGGLSGNLDVGYVLHVHDDGTGPALYVGGDFDFGGATLLNRIGRWDGSTWTPLAGGVSGTTFNFVSALTTYDDGSGPKLYVGGDFEFAGGVLVNHVACWDGTSFTSLGSGLSQHPLPYSNAFAAYDDGTGTGLYVSGLFTQAGSTPANYVAKWQGGTWSALGAGIDGTSFPAVWGLGVFGGTLWAGGSFETTDGIAASFLNRWGPDICTIGQPYCDANANSTGLAASITARGSTFASDLDVSLRATELPQDAFAFFVTSRTQGFTANPGGSAGNLCLAGTIGRYIGPGQVQSSGGAGQVDLTLDMTMIPTGSGFVSVMAGDTWNYQCWFRDAIGDQATSNFTDGVELVFQ